MFRTTPKACVCLAIALSAAGVSAQVSSVVRGPNARSRCFTLIPQAPTPFTEEAVVRGINYFVAEENTLDSGLGAASFADLDSDGDPDLIITGESTGLIGLYENDGSGAFIDRSASPGVALYLRSGGVTAADYDADGDLDLFISRVLRRDVLLRNEGGFVFTDVTDVAGILDEDEPSVGSTWGDFDGDGWLDLYVSYRTGTLLPDFTFSTAPNRLYHNQGDGTFLEVAVAMGVDLGLAPTLTAAFVDFDLDGDADLYVGNDKGTQCLNWTNNLFRNDKGVFTDITASSNTESCTDTMGIGIGDFDGNGWPDFYCTNTPQAPGHALMLNNGDQTFDWAASEVGVTGNQLGWSSIFFDHDNDGDLALFVAHSNTDNYLYDWSETWPVPEIGAQMGLNHPGPTYNASSADIDGDGDIDLVVQDIFGLIKLYINNEGSRRHWVRFRVVGENPNRDAIGAIVRCFVNGGMQISEVLAGGNNYRTQNELIAHFGLDAACTVDSVGVQWTDGQTRTITGYTADETWSIYPPSMLGDNDFDGRFTTADLAAMLTSLGPVRPGTEIHDINGDGRIDARDWRLLLVRVGIER